MAENKEQLLQDYVKYINGLAETHSSQMFTNGGIEYASELMAVLFKYTEKEVRIFCQGFKPDLITTEPYWSALCDYLKRKDRTLKVLVETDAYVHERPITLLNEEINKRNDDSIQIKIASAETAKEIYKQLSGTPCNFAIFDDNKFRFENEPEKYKAFGSFNRKDYANVLINVFDKAFNKSEALS